MHMKLQEISASSFLRTILETWSLPGDRMLRKVTDSVAALTVESDQPGWYLMRTSEGWRFLPVMAVVADWRLTEDGRLFPQERGHYLLALVQSTGASQEKGDE
jgi:hypothetical protein